MLALALLVPVAFPVYWDPPSIDRYFALSRQPLRPKVVAYAKFIRETTPRDAVFVAGRRGQLDPRADGRRVVLAEGGRLMPPDKDERKNVERTLLLSDDPGKIRGAALRYGVTHLAIDDALVQEYGVSGFEALAKGPLFRTLYVNSAAPYRRARAAVTPATRRLAPSPCSISRSSTRRCSALRVPARDTDLHPLAWFLTFRQGGDSWRPMNQAYDFATSPEGRQKTLYEKLFFSPAVKHKGFQYPPTSLLAIAVSRVFGETGGLRVLEAVTWLSIPAMAFLCFRIYTARGASTRGRGSRSRCSRSS